MRSGSAAWIRTFWLWTLGWREAWESKVCSCPWIGSWRPKSRLSPTPFTPYVLEHFQRSGGLFALPVSAVPLMLHYDARWFEAKNVPPVDESWDWDDLVENAKKLTWRSEDGKLTRWGLMSHMYGLWWALWQNHAEMFDPATAGAGCGNRLPSKPCASASDLLHSTKFPHHVGHWTSSQNFDRWTNAGDVSYIPDYNLA